jgi:UDP-N-acetylglucosamine 3-dehydrogenase
MITNEIKVSCIGCGRHATKVIQPSLRYSGMNLVSVCDLDLSKARRNAKWFGAKSIYEDYNEMLKKEDIDLVVIVAGPEKHFTIAKNCIKHVKYVFIEKPPVPDLSSLQELINHSNQNGGKIIVGVMKRFAPIYEKVLSIIKTKPEFAYLTHVNAKLCAGKKRCSGYALLLDVGTHILDLLQHLFGKPELISYKKEKKGEFISYALLLKFGDVTTTVHIANTQSWVLPNERVEITGIESFMVADNLLHFDVYKKEGVIETWNPGFSIPRQECNSLYLQGYISEFRDLAKSIINKKEPNAQLKEFISIYELIQKIEPEEKYEKKPHYHEHWKEDDQWLNNNG